MGRVKPGYLNNAPDETETMLSPLLVYLTTYLARLLRL